MKYLSTTIVGLCLAFLVMFTFMMYLVMGTDLSLVAMILLVPTFHVFAVLVQKISEKRTEGAE